MRNRKTKKKQREYYSGKKKKHTIKVEIVISEETNQIICTSYCNGKKHDFKLFKESRLPINRDSLLIVDKGYLGIEKYHKNTLIAKKSSKLHKLSEQERYYNRIIDSLRIKVEHVIRRVKQYRIVSTKYRGNHKRGFGLCQ